MILMHLASNEKSILCESDNIILAEEIENKNDDGEELHYTRIYLKQPLQDENETKWLDVQENVKTLQTKIVRSNNSTK